MPTATTHLQLNNEDEKEFEREINIALSNTAGPDDPNLSVQEDYLRTNLKNLNHYLNANAVKEEAFDDGITLDFQDSTEVKYNPSSPPRKRQHRLKVDVCVPTMDLLEHECQLQAEEDYKKLDKMRNPKVKTKENMVLHRDTLRARFQALPSLELYPITLDKGSQDLMVSRDFMAATYGGSMQATCPSIGKRLLEKHGMDDFMYLHPAYQPVAPQVPGAHGLFLTPGSSIGREWSILQRIFTRVDSNVWQYMGMYRLTSSPSLTKSEWADQEPKVQRTWGREICRQGWGGEVRAGIFARKRLGREPTKEEFEALYEEGSRAHSVTPEEIMAAFMEGEETLGIWLMECVGYDNDFQLQLCEKFPLWNASPKKARGSGKSRAKKSRTGGPTTVRVGRKRKRGETPDSDTIDSNPEDQDEEATTAGRIQQPQEPEFRELLPVDEDDIRAEEVLAYRHRGTRSRPIRL